MHSIPIPLRGCPDSYVVYSVTAPGCLLSLTILTVYYKVSGSNLACEKDANDLSKAVVLPRIISFHYINPFMPVVPKNAHPFMPVVPKNAHPFMPVVPKNAHPFMPVVPKNAHPFMPVVPKNAHPFMPVVPKNAQTILAITF